MQSEFHDLGFKKYFFCKGMPSVAGQFTNNNRCGIYILHFENGEYYVGLTNDAVNRYAQHRLNHSDIEYISFKEVAKSKLVEAEKEIIYELEKLKKPLRNINIVSIILGDTDLDLIVSKKEQTKWINYELPWSALNTERFEYPELRNKYSKQFMALKQNKQFEDICAILQGYVIAAIPLPRKTQYSFWSCSCLPTTGDKPLVRINIYWQETFVIYEDVFELLDSHETINGLTIRIWLSKNIFEENFTEEELTEKYNTIEFIDRVWPSGGQDQKCVSISGFEFFDFIYTPKIQDAVKDFNLRLMRKGGCIFNRYHCFDLADQAVRIDNLEVEV